VNVPVAGKKLRYCSVPIHPRGFGSSAPRLPAAGFLFHGQSSFDGLGGFQPAWVSRPYSMEERGELACRPDAPIAEYFENVLQLVTD
jgi:hypothetical protein